jgi:hypothetical protein
LELEKDSFGTLKIKKIVFFEESVQKRTVCLCTVQNVLAQNKTFWYENRMFLPAAYHLSDRWGGEVYQDE